MIKKIKYFSKEINKLEKIIEFKKSDTKLLGSASLRNILYVADYDYFSNTYFDNVNTLYNEFKSILKKLIKQKELYITDIKCGDIEEFKVLNDNMKWNLKENKIENYDYDECKKRIKYLYGKKIIDRNEYDLYDDYLKQNPNIKDYYIIKKNIRPNIIRWNANEIIKGHKIYRNKKIRFKDVLMDKSLFKMDILTDINNTLTEVSIIYNLIYKGKKLYKDNFNFKEKIEEDILYYNSIGNYYKTLKRLLSLNRYLYQTTNKDEYKSKIKIILDILNTYRLGVLYKVVIFLDNIKLLCETVYLNESLKNKIEEDIDNMYYKLNNITDNDYIKKEKRLLTLLNNIPTKPIMKHIEIALNEFNKLLQNETKEVINGL